MLSPPVAALAALLLWTGTSLAANCPALSFKTVDAECRWVMGRPVACNASCAPGTRAFFSCKPLYRLPLSVRAASSAASASASSDTKIRIDVDDNGMESSMCRENGNWAPLPFTCVPECGRLVGNGETLIVDGKPVNSPIEYPWHVAVYDKKFKGGIAQICGGTLVTTKFFVSAAHCFTSKSADVTMRLAEEFAAAAGKLNREWASPEDSAQRRDVLHIHINGYGGSRLNFVRDLALVELTRPVTLTAFTLPACVDWGHQEHLRSGDVGAVIGWGGFLNAPVNSKLHAAELPFVPKDKCLEAIPSRLVPYVMSNDRFCAGIINGTTVAHGDSGGGLVFPNRQRRWFLQGVVSVGMPELRTYAAFTNVTSFSRWMADKIQDEEIRAAAAEHHVPLEIPLEYTASDLDEEHRVAYHREDVGLNLFHMHWHYFYYKYLSPPEMRKMDRRGELLFYMHGQLIARYNVERLSNHLPRVKKLVLREPIKEGYYPKLDTLVASRVWPGRPPYTRLQDLNRDNMKIDIEDLERWTARIYDAIAMGYLVNTTGGAVPLTEEGGAELLANTIESTSLSPNEQLYGELTNLGHILISLAADPENRYLESFGVMGDAAVSLRDPVFYRWHTYIQDIMHKYKDTLPSYSQRELGFDDVFVRGVDVFSESSTEPNLLSTYWQASDLMLSRGLDFSPRQPVFVRLIHLQHQPFSYNIQIDNRGNYRKEGYVRIFLAPDVDEHGKLMSFNDQRHFMIEMDKFVVKLRPGMNVVRRASVDSSLTIPFERTFRDLDANRGGHAGKRRDEFTFCGCGLPQHLLLPKGDTDGVKYSLFVMVSDYAQDKVEQTLQGQCNKAHSLCGVYEGKYPDKRPIGFPFDRRPPSHTRTLRAFLRPNMFVQDVVVRFKDTVVLAARNVTVFGTETDIIKLPMPLGVSANRIPDRQAWREQQQPQQPQQDSEPAKQWQQKHKRQEEQDDDESLQDAGQQLQEQERRRQQQQQNWKQQQQVWQ